MSSRQGSSVLQHLHAIKKILQDATPEVKIATVSDKAEFDALERDVFEILRLVRSWRNMVAPINKTPPEILVLVPDFLAPEDRDQGVIALSHVCQVWREVFVSWSSLWTNFDCADRKKTCVYLERSESSPINLSLHRRKAISPCDPFFQIIPHAIGRLESISIEATPENVQGITSHLSHPAPLLKHLTMRSHRYCSYLAPISALFNGDLSSLRTLDLGFVRTELPWRNMVNLTSFTLAHTQKGVSIGQLLDFFESAPHLCEVTLRYATPTTGAQNGRLVSLVCLKSMYIEGDDRSSLLLDHLLIPAGARLETRMGLSSSLIGEHLPRSLDNLKNFSSFTTIQLYFDKVYPRMEFSGPNGEVSMTPGPSHVNLGDLVFKSLAQFDTSKTERLEISHCYYHWPRDYLYRVLLPLTDLRTLTLSECVVPITFVHALHPDMSSSEVMACPKLEELVLVLRVEGRGDKFDITGVIEMAAARASRGEKLRTVRIVNGRGIADLDVLELRKHVPNVEYNPWVDGL